MHECDQEMMAKNNWTNLNMWLADFKGFLKGSFLDPEFKLLNKA